jgi:hypothetical protein
MVITIWQPIMDKTFDSRVLLSNNFCCVYLYVPMYICTYVCTYVVLNNPLFKCPQCTYINRQSKNITHVSFLKFCWHSSQNVFDPFWQTLSFFWVIKTFSSIFSAGKINWKLGNKTWRCLGGTCKPCIPRKPCCDRISNWRFYCQKLLHVCKNILQLF